jgi:hypothetical protein
VFSKILRALAVLASIMIVLIVGAHLLARPAGGNSTLVSILNQPLYAVQRLDALVQPAAVQANDLLSAIPGYSWLLSHASASHADVLQRFSTAFLMLLVCLTDAIWTLVSCTFRIRVRFDAASTIKTRTSEAGKHAIRQPGQSLSRAPKVTPRFPKK